MTSNQSYSKTTYMALCGLFAGLTALCSLIMLPLGFTPVPLNLGTLAVFLAAGILGMKYGTISIVVYVLLGATGIPIFSGFRGGISVLVGPTGGYILGYIAAAFIIGFIIDRLYPHKVKGKSTGYAISFVVGTMVCYFLGTLWFMFSTNTGLMASLTSCVFPFLLGDAIKILSAAVLLPKLCPHLT